MCRADESMFEFVSPGKSSSGYSEARWDFGRSCPVLSIVTDVATIEAWTMLNCENKREETLKK